MYSFSSCVYVDFPWGFLPDIFIDSWVLAKPKCAVKFFISELFEIRECRQCTELAIHTLAFKRDSLALIFFQIEFAI